MRLPGFFHRKGEPFRTQVIEERPAQPYDRGELIEAFGLDQSNGPAPKGDGIGSTGGTSRRART